MNPATPSDCQPTSFQSPPTTPRTLGCPSPPLFSQALLLLHLEVSFGVGTSRDAAVSKWIIIHEVLPNDSEVVRDTRVRYILVQSGGSTFTSVFTKPGPLKYKHVAVQLLAHICFIQDQEANQAKHATAALHESDPTDVFQGPPIRGPPSRGPPSRGPPSRGPPSRGPPSRGPTSRGPINQGQNFQQDPAVPSVVAATSGTSTGADYTNDNYKGHHQKTNQGLVMPSTAPRDSTEGPPASCLHGSSGLPLPASSWVIPTAAHPSTIYANWETHNGTSSPQFLVKPSWKIT